MGGGQRDDTFQGGGGTFRDRNSDPMMYHPVMPYAPQQQQGSLGDVYGFAGKDPKKIYDMEALKRLVELLNQGRDRKPYGSQEGSNIGF